MARKIKVKLEPKYVMKVTRSAVGNEKLVYVILISKQYKYTWGRSSIVYIGTTKRGVTRISQSVAKKSDRVLKIHGVKEFSVRIITCAGRRKVKTWEKLERALILTFRHKFGSVPLFNDRGKKHKWGDELDYFRQVRLTKILESIN